MANKIKINEGVKSVFKSKTVWVAITTLVLAVLSVLGVPVPPEVYAVLGALGLYGVRDAQGLKK